MSDSQQTGYPFTHLTEDDVDWSTYPDGVGCTTYDPEVDGDQTGLEHRFVLDRREANQDWIFQPYHLFSDDNHDTWRRLFEQINPAWEKFAHPRFLEGVEKLSITKERIPKFEEINEFLKPLTGFEARAVSDYIPAGAFFTCLEHKVFPTTVPIRNGRKINYCSEPDCWHDLAGHVPMHTDKVFADVLVAFGKLSRDAALRVQELKCSDEERRSIAASNIRALARFFWFTVEVGIMKRPKGDGSDMLNKSRYCINGSGILSSYGEINHCLTDKVQRIPFSIDHVVNQAFEIHRYQPLLFVAESFEQIIESVHTLRGYLNSGRLDDVGPCEPVTSPIDVQSYLTL